MGDFGSFFGRGGGGGANHAPPHDRFIGMQRGGYDAAPPPRGGGYDDPYMDRYEEPFRRGGPPPVPDQPFRPDPYYDDPRAFDIPGQSWRNEPPRAPGPPASSWRGGGGHPDIPYDRRSPPLLPRSRGPTYDPPPSFARRSPPRQSDEWRSIRRSPPPRRPARPERGGGRRSMNSRDDRRRSPIREPAKRRSGSRWEDKESSKREKKGAKGLDGKEKETSSDKELLKMEHNTSEEKAASTSPATEEQTEEKKPEKIDARIEVDVSEQEKNGVEHSSGMVAVIDDDVLEELEEGGGSTTAAAEETTTNGNTNKNIVQSGGAEKIKPAAEVKILSNATFEEVHRPGVKPYGSSGGGPPVWTVKQERRQEASWVEQWKAKVMMTKTSVHGFGGPSAAPPPPVPPVERPPLLAPPRARAPAPLPPDYDGYPIEYDYPPAARSRPLTPPPTSARYPPSAVPAPPHWEHERGYPVAARRSPPSPALHYPPHRADERGEVDYGAPPTSVPSVPPAPREPIPPPPEVAISASSFPSVRPEDELDPANFVESLSDNEESDDWKALENLVAKSKMGKQPLVARPPPVPEVARSAAVEPTSGFFSATVLPSTNSRFPDRKKQNEQGEIVPPARKAPLIETAPPAPAPRHPPPQAYPPASAAAAERYPPPHDKYERRRSGPPQVDEYGRPLRPAVPEGFARPVPTPVPPPVHARPSYHDPYYRAPAPAPQPRGAADPYERERAGGHPGYARTDPRYYDDPRGPPAPTSSAYDSYGRPREYRTPPSPPHHSPYDDPYHGRGVPYDQMVTRPRPSDAPYNGPRAGWADPYIRR